MAGRDSESLAEPIDDAGMTEVQGPEEIPQFNTEAEERAFWATHSIGEQWFARVRDQPPADRRVPPWVRLRAAGSARRGS